MIKFLVHKSTAKLGGVLPSGKIFDRQFDVCDGAAEPPDLA